LATSRARFYATDFQNNLYNVNSVTGTATLIGFTGILAIPFALGSFNDDGTINFYDEAIFGSAGNLYETFDTFTFDLNSFTVLNTIVAPALYQIDPSSGLGTLVGTTDLSIGAVAGVDGTYYAFNDMTGQIQGLNLASGNTNSISNFDSRCRSDSRSSPCSDTRAIVTDPVRHWIGRIWSFCPHENRAYARLIGRQRRSVLGTRHRKGLADWRLAAHLNFDK
jgi:hypothetical protein